MLNIIPAIDLLNNQCVRLTKGNYSQITVYSDDPVDMALNLQDQGADILHVIDLDGAKEGRSVHLPLIKKMVSALSIPVEVGGGIRDLITIDSLLNAGVRRIILGTVVVRSPEFAAYCLSTYPDNIIFGFDARYGKLSVSGWLEDTEQEVLTTIQEWQQKGLRELIYTDINRDGMMEGPNIQALTSICKTLKGTGIRIIASGGITKSEHIIELGRLTSSGVSGCIIGKALYEGKIDLREVRTLVDKME